MKKSIWIVATIAGCALAVGLSGCAGTKKPEMITGTTVSGLPPLAPGLSTKVKCTDESYASECLDAQTGSEHCKFMMRRNAEQELFRELTETLMTTTDEGGRVAETMDSELEVARSFVAENALNVQFSQHESNLFHQVGRSGDEVMMRICVIIDEAAGHYYRSLKAKAEATKRDEIADFAELMLKEMYGKQGVADSKDIERTTEELYEHFTMLYNDAQAQMADKG